MAMTVTVAVNPSTVLINQKATVSCTVSNSGGAAVNVNSLTPIITATGATGSAPACATSSVDPAAPNFVNSVPASGSLVLTYDVICFAPSVTTYNCNVQVACSDGSNITATAATLTVNPLPLPATEL